MKYTDTALRLMKCDKWYEAQRILREGAEKEPCCETYNDLGVFYMDNGIQHIKNESEEAVDIGYNYIKMAYNFGIEYKNLIAIAEYNYYYKSVEKACEYYKKASEVYEDYRVYNNMGCCCYRLGGYIKAAIYFTKALEYADKNTDDIKISLCYALYKCNEDYSSVLESISNEKWTGLDRFILYYLMGNKERACSLAKEIIEKWEFALPVVAMLYDCFEEYDIAGINKFDSEVSELVNTKKKREIVISEYEYTPVMLWQCKYIGCREH